METALLRSFGISGHSDFRTIGLSDSKEGSGEEREFLACSLWRLSGFLKVGLSDNRTNGHSDNSYATEGGGESRGLLPAGAGLGWRKAQRGQNQTPSWSAWGLATRFAGYSPPRQNYSLKS